MAGEHGRGERVVYTVGHSNYPLEVFLALLKASGIEVLADVRSQPYAQYTPHFNEGSLKVCLPQHGVRYLFLGKELGGRPEGTQFYDADDRVDYARLAASPLFAKGLAVLEREALARRVVLLCGEEDPASCHRRLLVGRVLGEHGFVVAHIRGDGRVQSEAELSEAEQFARNRGQLSLFDNEETPAWKSTRSASPGKRPGSSSGR